MGKHHEIIAKSPCRLGKVQIEDWGPVYPSLEKTCIVALYAPLAESRRTIRSLYDNRGQSHRFSFDFSTMAEARDCYLALREGADPHDWEDAFVPGDPTWTDEDTRRCLPH